MLENYVAARGRGRSRWTVPFLCVSGLLHVVGGLGLYVSSAWAVEKLPLPSEQTTIAVPIALPPEAPPAEAIRIPPETKTAMVKVKTVVQPTATVVSDPQEVVAGTGVSSDTEATGPTCPPGEPACLMTCAPGDPLCRQEAPPPIVPAVKAPSPTVVSSRALEAQRVAGKAQIVPPMAVRSAISRDRRSTVVAAVELCLRTDGSVREVKLRKGSGYGSYDREILSTVKKWRYRPFRVAGVAQPVCTRVTFVYKQDM